MADYGGGGNPYAQADNPYGGGPPGGGPPGGGPPAGNPYGGGPPGGPPGGNPYGGGPPGGAPGGYGGGPPDQFGGPPGGPPGGGGYPPAGGGYPPAGGGYPPAGGPPGGPPGGAPGGYPPPDAGGYPPQQGGYPPQQGGPPGYPPQGGDQGGYPPGQEGDRGKVTNQMGQWAGGAQQKWQGMSTQQQAGVGVAGALLAGGAAYGAYKYNQSGQPQQGGGGSGYPPPGGQQQGGYPGYNPSGHGNMAYAGGGGLAGGLAAGGAAMAYQQYQAHQNPGQAVNYQQVAAIAAGGAVAGAVGGYAYGKFFANAKHRVDRDYVVIVDKSGSMQIGDTDKDMQRCTRWDNARKAVELLAPKITQFDRDGICVWLFSSGAKKFDNIREPNQVKRIFQENGPSGSTNLSGVLDKAFEDFFRKGKPVTYLIITDGEPDCEDAARRSIEQASNRLRQDADMSLTFVQVGDDQGAQQFLKNLDDKVGMQCKFDIVDTVKDDDLRRIGFEQLIEQSVND